MTAKKRQDIPVDKDGMVPLKALASRFQQVGSRKDSSNLHAKVLPQRVTPEEVADWWDDPSSCDIQGIDTPNAPIYSVPVSIKGRKRKALGKIAVISSKKEANRIRRIMAEHYTESELEELASGCSLVISTVPHLRDCTGFYLRKQDGIPVPEIVFEEGTTEDGIVHEITHALRAKQGRSAFPTDKNGKLISGYDKLPKKKRQAIESKEEKETVVETVARTKPDPCESGYYGRVPGVDSRAAYIQDQLIVSRSRALKGQAAIKAAEQNYDRTTISRAVISGNLKKKRRRCSGRSRNAMSRSMPRKTPREHHPPSGTSTSTSGRPGFSTTAMPRRSTLNVSRWAGTGIGAIWWIAWITSSSIARRPKCRRSRSRSTNCI